jgi:hypothetical protein
MIIILREIHTIANTIIGYLLKSLCIGFPATDRDFFLFLVL